MDPIYKVIFLGRMALNKTFFSKIEDLGEFTQKEYA